MADKKLCPLAVVVGIGQDECAESSCAWWHGGMCDVSRIACALMPLDTPTGIRVDGDGLHFERKRDDA